MMFLGYRADVEDLYAAMDVYVLASYREGIPAVRHGGGRHGRAGRGDQRPGLPAGRRRRADRSAGAAQGCGSPGRCHRAAGPAIRLCGRRWAGPRIVKAREEFDDRRVIDFTLALYARLLTEKCGCP